MIYREIQDDSNQHRVACIRRCRRCLHDWSPRLRRPPLALQTGIINRNNNQHELVSLYRGSIPFFLLSVAVQLWCRQLGLRPFRSAHLWRVDDPRDGPGSNRGRTFPRRRILSDAIRGQRHYASLLFRFRWFHPWNCHGKLHEWRSRTGKFDPKGNIQTSQSYAFDSGQARLNSRLCHWKKSHIQGSARWLVLATYPRGFRSPPRCKLFCFFFIFCFSFLQLNFYVLYSISFEAFIRSNTRWPNYKEWCQSWTELSYELRPSLAIVTVKTMSKDSQRPAYITRLWNSTFSAEALKSLSRPCLSLVSYVQLIHN